VVHGLSSHELRCIIGVLVIAGQRHSLHICAVQPSFERWSSTSVSGFAPFLLPLSFEGMVTHRNKLSAARMRCSIADTPCPCSDSAREVRCGSASPVSRRRGVRMVLDRMFNHASPQRNVH
jgi:hypothetical protein